MSICRKRRPTKVSGSVYQRRERERARGKGEGRLGRAEIDEERRRGQRASAWKLASLAALFREIKIGKRGKAEGVL
jgi:hypothetical protein